MDRILKLTIALLLLAVIPLSCTKEPVVTEIIAEEDDPSGGASGDEGGEGGNGGQDNPDGGSGNGGAVSGEDTADNGNPVIELPFEGCFGSPTKAYMWQDPNGTSVYPRFNVGDQIDVFPYNGTGKSIYEVTSVQNDGVAHFDGNVVQSGSGKYLAIYPSGSASANASGTLSFEVPTFQTLPSDTAHFCPSAMPSIACATPEGQLYFRNVCAMVRVKVTQSNVSEITVVGNNREIVSGYATSLMADADGVPSDPAGYYTGSASSPSPKAADATDATDGCRGEQYVVLRAPEGKFFTKNHYYYIPVLPQMYTRGISVYFTYGTGTKSGKSDGQILTSAMNLLRNRGVSTDFTATSGYTSFFMIVNRSHLETMQASYMAKQSGLVCRVCADVNMRDASGVNPNWDNQEKRFYNSIDGQDHTGNNTGFRIYNLLSNTDNLANNLSGGGGQTAGFLCAITGNDSVVSNLVFGSKNGTSYDGVSLVTCSDNARNIYAGAVVGKVSGGVVSKVVNWCPVSLTITTTGSEDNPVTPGTPADHNKYMGGIVGLLEDSYPGTSDWNRNPTIIDCVNNGTLTVQGVHSAPVAGDSLGCFMGGIVGRMFKSQSAIIKRCTNNAAVVNKADLGINRDVNPLSIGVGGILGISSKITNEPIAGWHACMTIEECVNNATLTAEVDSVMVGGITCLMQNGGTVKSCTNNGSLTVRNGKKGVEAGGIVCVFNNARPITRIDGVSGTLYPKVTSCENTGNIGNTSTSTLYNAGGIVGRVSGAHGPIEISSCTNSGNITLVQHNVADAVNSYHGIGGVLGYMGVRSDGSPQLLSLLNCSNSGRISVTGTVRYNVGGVFGKNVSKATVQGCTNSGEITTSGNVSSPLRLGGIIGANEYCADASEPAVGECFTVKLCENTGYVHAENNTGNVYVGGIIGYDYGKFSRIGATADGQGNINRGHVRANTSGYVFLGGIAGSVETNYIFRYNYNYGRVSTTGLKQNRVGGVIGYLWSSLNAPLTDCVNEGQVDLTTDATWNREDWDSERTDLGGLCGCIITYGGCTVSRCTNRGYVSACYNNANLSKVRSIGGIVGVISSMVAGTSSFSSCVNSGTLSSKTEGLSKDVMPPQPLMMGGILGYFTHSVENTDVSTLNITSCNNYEDTTSPRPRSTTFYCLGSGDYSAGGILGGYRGDRAHTININGTSTAYGENTASINSGRWYMRMTGGIVGGNVMSGDDLATLKVQYMRNAGAVNWKASSGFTDISPVGSLGGIIGAITNSADVVSDCEHTGSITVNILASSNIGGIAGSNYKGATIKNCTCSGPVTYDYSTHGSSSSFDLYYLFNVGGIVGYQEGGKTQSCIGGGSVTINCKSKSRTYTSSGGIAGQVCAGTVTACKLSSNVSVISNGDMSGGIVGMISCSGTTGCTVSNCQVRGSAANLLMVKGRHCVAEIVGGYKSGSTGNKATHNITKCMASGSNARIYATGMGVAGILGGARDATDISASYNLNINNCYVQNMPVIHGGNDVGGYYQSTSAIAGRISNLYNGGRTSIYNCIIGSCYLVDLKSDTSGSGGCTGGFIGYFKSTNSDGDVTSTLNLVNNASYVDGHIHHANFTKDSKNFRHGGAFGLVNGTTTINIHGYVTDLSYTWIRTLKTDPGMDALTVSYITSTGDTGQKSVYSSTSTPADADPVGLIGQRTASCTVNMSYIITRKNFNYFGSSYSPTMPSTNYAYKTSDSGNIDYLNTFIGAYSGSNPGKSSLLEWSRKDSSGTSYVPYIASPDPI